MIRSLTLAALAFLCCIGAAVAQPLCGFDAQHRQQLTQDPVYAANVQQSVTKWIQSQQSSQNSLISQSVNGPFYEIPVVIHVIHDGGVVGSKYNPSDLTLIGMLNYLNATYAAQWNGYPDTNNGGVRFPVRFVLAKRDTACGSTTGIIRVNGSSVTNYVANGISTGAGGNEVAVKALSRWPSRDYYNIWVVNMIDGKDGTSGTFTAGYAYFPGASPAIDGTVMLATQAVAGQSTLPHEIGHAFSLYHTFEDDIDANGNSVCPPSGPCASTGDLVCDTDPHKRSPFNCQPNATNPCTGTLLGNVVKNFMDYSSCNDLRFTAGQRLRWLDGLLNSRASLLSSLGGVAPGTSAPSAACAVSNTLTAPAFVYNSQNAGPVKVSFADMTSETSGGYVSDGNRAYLNRTCVQQANVIAGNTYSLSVTVNGGTGANTHRVRVWLDLNNDGTFTTTNPNELIYSANSTTTSSTLGFTYNASYLIPTTIATCVPIRMRVIADRNPSTAVNGACSALYSGQAEDYLVYAKSAAATAMVDFAPGSANPSCSGSSLSFNATSTGATNATYVWYRNNTIVQTSGTSYTTTSLTNGDRVRVKMYFNDACGLADSVVSNDVVISQGTTVTPQVSIAVTSGSNPGCPNQPVTFTATPTNGGSTPGYQWRVNGTPVPGATGSSFTTTTLAASDVVTVLMTSSSPCASSGAVVSNGITISFSTLTAAVTIVQTAGPTPACANKTVTFTATPTNGGTAPTYQWLINGTPATGAASNVFTFVPVQGDVLQAVLISNNPCVTNPQATSGSVLLTVAPADTSRLTVELTQGANPGCTDSLLEFTATTQNMGSPLIDWYVNGSAVASGAVYSTTTLQDGDVLTARAIATGAGCRTQDTLQSPSVTLVRSTPPSAPVISFIAGNLIANAQNVQWWGPSGAISGATAATYHPTAAGLYYATAVNSGCASLPSNKLQVSMLSVGTLDLSGVSIFPNPTSGSLTIDWGRQQTAGTLDLYTSLGQHLLTERVNGQTSKTLDLGRFPSGTYFLVVRNAAGEAATVPVTLQR